MPSKSLIVTYAGKTAEWTPAALAALPHTTVTVHNSHNNTTETYSGVPLIDLLAKIGVPAAPVSKDLRMYLVAEGTDGYKVTYSIGEIAPNTHDAIVLVADSLGGKDLGTAGIFQLVGTRDVRPARWVHNLTAIRVFTVE